MTQLVQPRLVNPPEGDPGVYLDFRFGRRAMLFDMGDLSPLTPRELLRVSHVFVSHAHMDHVAGTDRLLRLRLNRPRPLCMTGPAGFVRQVESRLNAFTWNLLDETSTNFRLTVQEFDGTRIVRAAEFRAHDAFHRRDLAPADLPEGVVLADEDFSVEAVALDHGIPSLAFAFQESLRVNVWKTALDGMGLPVGPWLEAAKSAIRSGAPDDHDVDVPGYGTRRLGDLRGQAFRVGSGQRVVYVTDAADTEANRTQIMRLAQNADHLFIETPFLDDDRDLAKATAHLTARAAGEIARAAGARRVIGFHHSARYADRPGALEAELADALGQDAEPARVAPGLETGPNWVRRWRREGVSTEAALARFDTLPPVMPDEMLGAWRGGGLPTGHSLDGLLEHLGWHGKHFASVDHVDPLVFEPGIALDPRLMPVRIALRWPRVAKSAATRTAFRLCRRLLRASGPAARLATVGFRGSASAAMVYDRQPIVDHFRRIDERRILGLMNMRGVAPYFFLLTKDAVGEWK
ncbi:GXWXG domain-containing protein [Pseudosulfitobacter koreensis]|uniref:GXWXG domain-containing protein n=1 Tax=Pseudosulfitobacter koreensis TaxID=2968472 RepID=A0ABT1YZL2_9RHOB|nr:GXWXG domain-containing protein [Pseudosulfitobacter koreense]MCR8826281.1 GXWXG domain-containing protein [Pseudosulfitobacter koreense]